MDKIRLEFDSERRGPAGSGQALAESLSALARVGDTLFAGGDEGVSLTRLRAHDDGQRLIERDAVDLRRWFDLPRPEVPPSKKKVPELDLEGMDVAVDGDQATLWLVGSHSFKRAKAEAGESDADNLKALLDVSPDGNRFFLGCVPLRREVDGQWGLATDGSRAAQIDPSETANPLLAALRGDRLFGRFLQEDRTIPGKDNGLDIEGLACAPHGRLLVGLRGPVLRGVATILEVAPERVADNGTADRLRLTPVGPNGAVYRRHFLDLGGNGVRDLCFDGDDLLILGGPTMVLDAPPQIFRWRDARPLIGTSIAEGFHWRGSAGDIEAVDLAAKHFEWKPSEPGTDHAEALMFLDEQRRKLLIAYDAPSASRLGGKADLRADVIAWR